MNKAEQTSVFLRSDSFDHSIFLPVMEQFYTIQGEGYYSGKAAYFIRLAGCDVGCVWCDVKESWNANDYPLIAIKELIKKIKSTPANFIVITGGEPAMYNLSSLINSLHNENFQVAIETSGAYPLLGDVDWYCFSPKKFKSPVSESYKKADELKVVIQHPSDFVWAEEHAKLVSKTCMLFLQPEWSKQERFLPLVIDYVKNNPKWNISLQTHKFMNIP